MENKKFTNGTTLTYAKKDSVRDCQKFCQQTVNCSKFTYIKDTYNGVFWPENRKLCALSQDSSMDVIDTDDFVSGPKQCPSKIVIRFALFVHSALRVPI